MPLEAGTRVGVFEILAPFGKGGMGEVYRARDTSSPWLKPFRGGDGGRRS